MDDATIRPGVHISRAVYASTLMGMFVHGLVCPQITRSAILIAQGNSLASYEGREKDDTAFDDPCLKKLCNVLTG